MNDDTLFLCSVFLGVYLWAEQFFDSVEWPDFMFLAAPMLSLLVHTTRKYVDRRQQLQAIKDRL